MSAVEAEAPETNQPVMGCDSVVPASAPSYSKAEALQKPNQLRTTDFSRLRTQPRKHSFELVPDH